MCMEYLCKWKNSHLTKKLSQENIYYDPLLKWIINENDFINLIGDPEFKLI